MRNRFLVAALLLCMGLGMRFALPTGAAEAVDAKKIEKLIEKLGSDDFTDREKATTELDAIGTPALPALKKAAKGTDVEASKRATDLVTRIERRNESVRILAPKMVHLVYRNTPVMEAAADFGKKSGYPINIFDPENKLKDRKISLDTGEVTFWKAMELFCEQAGLVEVDPLQGIGGFGPGINVRPVVRPLPVKKIPQPDTKPEEKKDEKFQVQAQVQIQIGGPGVAPIGGPVVGWGFGGGIGGNQLILVDGKAKPMPTDASGAIRVRAMEKADLLGPIGEKEILLGLQVTAEPKIQIQMIQGVKINKAVDDKDQDLMQMPEPKPDGNAPFARPALARVGFVGGMSQMTPVRLKKAEKPSKSLKELTGVILAQILAPATPVITVEKIMAAAGKEVKGAEGGKIKITEVTKDANGQITVKFELEMPPNIFPAGNPYGGGIGAPGIQIIPGPAAVPPRVVPPAPPQKEGPQNKGEGFQVKAAPPQAAPPVPVARPGVVVGGPMMPLAAGNGVTMEDEKGKTIPVVGNAMNFRRGPNGVIRENVMVFLPAKDQVPAKLVVSGSKSVAVEVPFSLKNVTLP